MKIWEGDPPSKCDICKRPTGDHFVDGKTKMGPWAAMCLACHKTHGVGLGIGRGQFYTLVEEDDCEKIP